MRRFWRLAGALLLMVTLTAVTGCKNGDGAPDEDKEAKSEAMEEKEAKKKAKETAEKGETITDKMAEEHEGDQPEPSPMAEMEPAQPVTGREVSYAKSKAEGKVVGYMAEPKDAEGKLPSIIVIHEWWGLNDNIRKMTRALAGEGYRALAVDLYNGEVAEKPGKARELMQKAMNNKESAEKNLRAAHAFLTKALDASSVGVIGWCFGGGWSLRTALLMPDNIDATVIYYGELITDKSKLKKLDMPVIGFFGSEDSAIPPAKVNAFESTLKELGKDVSVHIYEGANHAFANPSGERYDAEAATDAWKKTTAFLEEHLKGSEN